jgi:uncharacterized OB-fold protein
MSAEQKPLPRPSAVSAPYWEAAREHRLVIQACGNCGHRFFYPRSTCPRCLGTDLNWIEASGEGVVYSYTVLRQATTPGFEAEVPYVLAIVELDEGVRMTTNVIGCSPEDVRIGMPVEVVFDDVSPEVTLPKFSPR